MNKIKSHKKIIIALVISIAIFIIFASSLIVYGEYTKSSRARRVINAGIVEGSLFSSNYMTSTSLGGLNRRLIYVTDADAFASTEVTVCNFAQGNPTKMYERDIQYDLVVKLVRFSGESRVDAEAADIANDVNVTVRFNNGTPVTLGKNNRTQTFNNSGNHNTLTANIATTDRITIEFSSTFNEITNLGLEIQANLYPNENSYLEIYNLYAIFNPSVLGESNANSWTGSYIDPELTSPATLDGYNYSISGSGVGSITLRWDTRYLTINQLLLLPGQLSATSLTPETDGNFKYVTFAVDSSTKDYYDIQFYRNGTIEEGTTWSDMQTYVECEYNPS